VIESDQNGARVAGTHIEFGAFPAYVRSHIAHVPSTLDTETVALRLVAHGFRQADVATFVRAVCKWGGYAGIGGRVLGRNQPWELVDAFRGAAADVGAGVDVAIRRLLRLHGLGVSFASKHLRFLAPRVCAIMDTKMAAATGLQQSAAGLAHYSALCCGLAGRLEERRTPNPMNRPEGRWYAADVEMALFAVARRWAPMKRGLTARRT